MAAILLAACTLAAHADTPSPSTPPFAPPTRAPHYELLDTRGAYRLQGRREPIDLTARFNANTIRGLNLWRIGALRIHYRDGYTHCEPLVYGRNIDGFLASFATEVSVSELAPTAHLAAWTVPADASRVVDAIEIEVEALEAIVGILAMNRIAPQDAPIDGEPPAPEPGDTPP